MDQELHTAPHKSKVVSLAAFRQQLVAEEEHPPPPFRPAAAAHAPAPLARVWAIGRHHRGTGVAAA
jgi:hypothetical protein